MKVAFDKPSLVEFMNERNLGDQVIIVEGETYIMLRVRDQLPDFIRAVVKSAQVDQ